MFPPKIATVLDAFGVGPDTKAALYDFYLQWGNDVFEVFCAFADRLAAPEQVRPEDVLGMKPALIEFYLRRYHSVWRELRPTPSFHRPRFTEGCAAGVVMPLGRLQDTEGFAGTVAGSLRTILDAGQPLPEGLLIMAKNAHSGGREDLVSFDVVTEDLCEACDIALAEGRQHTTPGSIGETTTAFDADRKLALIWEIQPNIFKPSSTRNHKLAKTWRRNRNWHLATLTAAIHWYFNLHVRIFILRGQALQATHEVNPREPMTETVPALHDRTVQRVVAGLGAMLEPPTAEDATALCASRLMNTGLRKMVEREGATAALWCLAKM